MAYNLIVNVRISAFQFNIFNSTLISYFFSKFVSAVNCNHPGSIENGRVIITNGSTHYGSGVEYHCIPHFQRVGPYLRKCMDNGMWSGDEPTCEIVSNETQDSNNLGMSIGIGCGVVVFLLLLLGLVYLRL